MSTKFSIRPAPRKRPWICKRSPPCLPWKAIPKKLLATFWLKSQPPTAPFAEFQGSFTLDHVPPSRDYYGQWWQAPYWFDLNWSFTVDPARGGGGSAWTTPDHAPLGTWPELPIPLPPALFYYAAHVDASPSPWFGTLLITG